MAPGDLPSGVTPVSQILDFNAVSNVLKQRYEEKPVETAFVKDHPPLLDVPKDETMGGDAWNIAIKYAPTSTRATTVPLALANGSPDQYGKFNIPNLYSDYVPLQIAGTALDAAQGAGENAMVKLAMETLDGGHLAAYDSIANALFGNGGGARGQIASTSTVNTATITLADSQQALKFWAGQVLQVSADDGTGGAGVRSGTVTLAGVDPIAGTLTATGNWNSGITNVAASDYIFMNGDYNAVFTGFPGWIPPKSARPLTSTLFFGQDRTKNQVGLGGWAYDGAGAAYEDSIAQLVAMVCQYGGNPDRIYVSPLDFVQIAKQQSAKVIFDRAEVPSFTDPSIQFKGLTFVHPKGEAQIIAEPYCPSGHFFALTLSSWTLYSNGKIARPANNWIGQMWLPSYTDDVVQARIVTRAFLGCRSPGYNGHGTF